MTLPCLDAVQEQNHTSFRFAEEWKELKQPDVPDKNPVYWPRAAECLGERARFGSYGCRAQMPVAVIAVVVVIRKEVFLRDSRLVNRLPCDPAAGLHTTFGIDSWEQTKHVTPVEVRHGDVLRECQHPTPDGAALLISMAEFFASVRACRQT